MDTFAFVYVNTYIHTYITYVVYSITYVAFFKLIISTGTLINGLILTTVIEKKLNFQTISA